MKSSGVCPLPLLWTLSAAQTSTPARPVAQPCPNLNTTSVVCITNRAAVLPLPFSRPTVPGDSPLPLPEQSFNGTSVPGDPSFALVHAATFLVFDAPRGTAILGSNPVLETVFDNLGSAVHEAPVYVPSLNAIIVSNLEAGVVPQTIIDLDSSPPSMSEFVPNPPVLGVNGGRFADGTVYWAVAGGPGNFTYNGTEHSQVPGIYALDPVTREVRPLLNNYFGSRFNSPDDLVVDPDTGDIFFTDPVFGFALGLTDEAPVLDQATYRFRPSTGAVSIVEAEIVTPNGIAMSPDGKTVYISATGVAAFNFSAPVPRYVVRQLGPKSVYAFDARMTPAGKELVNKRPVWLPEEFVDDGLHVAADGTVVGAAGFSVDVLSPFGELLVKIQLDFYCQNVQFAGPELDELWIFGIGKIARVKWALKGMAGGLS